MDLENKLKNFPLVYYINLDHRTDRKKWMEDQFNYWGITNFRRVPASKYHVSKYDEWKDVVVEDGILECLSLMSVAINNIETVINWYDEYPSETCILMEDDLCLDNIKYWNFDWDYVENNLPENWECIQLYYVSPYEKDQLEVPMFLHPRIDSGSAAAYLINRRYAKKLKDMLYRDGKYRLTFCDNSYHRKNSKKHIIQDDVLFDIGITYSLPLFNLNVRLGGDNQQNNHEMSPLDMICTKLIKQWWTKHHHNFSLEDFFMYGKPNDDKMTLKVRLDDLYKFLGSEEFHKKWESK